VVVILITRSRLYSVCRLQRTNSQDVTERVGQVGPVERVEVEVIHARFRELAHLVGRDGDGDELARLDVVLEPVEHRRHAAGHGRARHRRELRHLREVRHRHDPRDDGQGDPRFAGAIDESQVGPVVEEELRDRA
jgi:hypothetical protein